MKFLTERLTKIEPAAGYRVRVEFADGLTAELDLTGLLDEGPIFAPLRDPAFFAAVKLHRGAPLWGDDLDLSPGAMRAWAEAGRLLSIEETDEWCTAHDTPSAAIA